MRKVTGLAAAAMMVVLSSAVFAQEVRERDPAARPREGAATRPGANAEASAADKELAAVMLACCRNEVELAKLAQQKASSDEVKEFAAKMVREHTEGCAKLEKWAGNLASARPAPGRETRPQSGRPAAEREVPEAAPEAAPRAEDRDIEVRLQPGADVSVRGGDRGGLNWVSIHQEISAQCLASAKKELSQKEGPEFDKCFIGMAIGGHQHAIDAEQVFQNHASPQFQAEIQNCVKMATGHLQEAKSIMKTLDGGTPRLSRKPE